MAADAGAPLIGVIINPIAGIGGRVALKGSDGPPTLRRAYELGAAPRANERALAALRAMRPRTSDTELLTAPEEMGELAARAAGFLSRVVGSINPGHTTAADTRAIALTMRDAGVALLMFAGGDGTARDLLDAVGTTVPLLGIPAGVKVFSGVFAINPARAGELACAFVHGQAELREGEVLDLDEEAYRRGFVSPALYGYASVPYRPEVMQGSKEPTPATDLSAARAAAADIVERMAVDQLHVLGPGTTTRAIADHLGLPKTLVGVDVVTRETVVVADATEEQLFDVVSRARTMIVVTPIGGQGFLFGRGNPQISPRVLRHVDRRDIVVVATPGKLAALHGRPLLVDTGDPACDARLAGYLSTITGYHERTLYRVST